MRTDQTQSQACQVADAMASLAVGLQRLQRCIAARLTLRACRVRRERGYWSVRLEAIVPPALSAATVVWPPSDRNVGYAIIRCRETASATTVSGAATLRLALAAALADLALESGLGLALFRRGSAGGSAEPPPKNGATRSPSRLARAKDQAGEGFLGEAATSSCFWVGCR